MSKTFLISISFFVLLNIPRFVQAKTPKENRVGVASLLVLIDMSSSMKPHREKLIKLAPLVADAMEKSRCEFRVGVASVEYKGLADYHLRPWSEPNGEKWITQDTPEGPDKIYQRIAHPNETVHPHYDGDQYKGVSQNGNERTYSSLVKSLNYNWEAIKDSNVIGTILLTDAAPAFETFSPQQADKALRNLLGDIPHVSASIVANIHEGMQVSPSQVLDPVSQKWVSTCRPDFPGNQEAGSMLATESWDSPYPEALNQFIEIIYGQRWDICEPQYDEELKKFVDMVLAVGGCLPLS